MKTVAIIVPTLSSARWFMSRMSINDLNLYMPMGVGHAIVGRMLDEVILVGWRPGDGGTPLLQNLGQDWFDMCVRTHRPIGVTDYTYIAPPEVITL